MPTYENAEDSVLVMANDIARRYHSELSDANVTIDVLMAFASKDANGDAVGAAVTHGGYSCMAKIRVVNLRDRTKGMGDAELILDGDRWDEKSEEEQEAILDHELTHLELVTDKDGLKRDDLGRPRLRLCKHDHQFGWFDSCVRRHGRNAIEFQQHEEFEERAFKQLWLPCIEEA